MDSSESPYTDREIRQRGLTIRSSRHRFAASANPRKIVALPPPQSGAGLTQALYPSRPMRALYSQRTAFEKSLHAELRPLLKGSAWRKSSYSLYNQFGLYYQEIYIAVHRNALLTTASLRFKPMAIDPILWEILGIPENRKEPLSFRALGAFTCAGLPILESQLEQPGDSPKDVAAALLDFSIGNVSLYQRQLDASNFSTLIANHPNQVARGAYAVTLVTSLINDGELELASDLASSYACGDRDSVIDFTRGGKSFHQLAIEWIESNANVAPGV